MGPICITFAILMFLAIIIFGCYYTFIWAVKILDIIIFYGAKLLLIFGTSAVLLIIFIIVVSVTCFAITEIVKAWKSKEKTVPPAKIFKEVDCVICKGTISEVLYVPCMHFCTCKNCMKMLGNVNMKCPICRERILEKYLRVMEDTAEDDEDEATLNIW